MNFNTPGQEIWSYQAPAFTCLSNSPDDQSRHAVQKNLLLKLSPLFQVCVTRVKGSSVTRWWCLLTPSTATPQVPGSPCSYLKLGVQARSLYVMGIILLYYYTILYLLYYTIFIILLYYTIFIILLYYTIFVILLYYTIFIILLYYTIFIILLYYTVFIILLYYTIFIILLYYIYYTIILS